MVTPQPADSHARAIFLIDGWPSFRRSLRLFLEASGHRVVGEADSVEQAAEMEDLRAADVVILDPRPDWSDIERDVRTIGFAVPAAGIVLLGAEPVFASAELIFGTVQLGVAAYLTKADPPTELLRAVKAALSREFVMLPRRLLSPIGIDPTIHQPLSPDGAQLAGRLPLTRRELEILTLCSQPYSNRQIADVLWVAAQTVEFHLVNVCRKLGVGTRAEAVAAARRLGLLDTVLVWSD